MISQFDGFYFIKKKNQCHFCLNYLYINYSINSFRARCSRLRLNKRASPCHWFCVKVIICRHRRGKSNEAGVKWQVSDAACNGAKCSTQKSLELEGGQSEECGFSGRRGPEHTKAKMSCFRKRIKPRGSINGYYEINGFKRKNSEGKRITHLTHFITNLKLNKNIDQCICACL